MILEGCQKKFLDTLNIDYVIIGYKNSGIKSIPPKYEICVVYANKGNVYEKLVGFLYYRIFDVSENKHSKDSWKDHFDDYMKTKKETEERDLYEQLKKKYE